MAAAVVADDGMHGEMLYVKMSEAFSFAQTADGKVLTGPACDAAKMIAPVYDRVFGEGYVSTYLKSDLVTHADGAKSAVDLNGYPDGKEPLDNYVERLVDTYGSAELRTNKERGMVNLVWMKRSLDFIICFLDCAFISMTDKPLYDAAVFAYDKVLRPYHGFMVSSIVSMAFNLCPARETLLKNLGFEEMTTCQAKLTEFLSISKPVVSRMDDVITRHGLDFPDTV